MVFLPLTVESLSPSLPHPLNTLGLVTPVCGWWLVLQQVSGLSHSPLLPLVQKQGCSATEACAARCGHVMGRLWAPGVWALLALSPNWTRNRPAPQPRPPGRLWGQSTSPPHPVLPLSSSSQDKDRLALKPLDC